MLLLPWNTAFYRYGSFDFAALEDCIRVHLPTLNRLRSRRIETLAPTDEAEMVRLFEDFCTALRIAAGPPKGRRSPVAAAKAFHVLAPHFFPLWDARIAAAYGRLYSAHPAAQYVMFCKLMQAMARHIEPYCATGTRSVLKLADEYNYAKYTKHWCG